MKNNPRITKKEKGLIKGALRRVFSRSDLRKAVIDTAEIRHADPKHPRVKRWSRCAECKEPTPRYKMQLDHKLPVVALDEQFDQLSLDVFVDRLWCEEHNLTPMCRECHDSKSKAENKQRREIKKGRSSGKN